LTDEKPLGWRPFDDATRAEYRGLGWSEEQIDKLEETNVYQPVETAVIAYHLTIALAFAATRHIGPEFAHTMISELERATAKLQNSGHSEEAVEGAIVKNFLDGAEFDPFIERASRSD